MGDVSNSFIMLEEVTDFPITVTRFCEARDRLSYASFDDGKGNHDVILKSEKGNSEGFLSYYLKNNMERGLSCFEIIGNNCFFKKGQLVDTKTNQSEVEEEFEDKRRHPDKYDSSLNVKMDRILVRWFCMKLILEKKEDIPEGWKFVKNGKYKDSNNIEFNHYLFQRKVDGEVKIISGSVNTKLCNLENDVGSINGLNWTIHHFFIMKANAYPENFNGFDDPDMQTLFEYFIEWLDIGYDNEYEEQILQMIQLFRKKQQFEEILDLHYKYEKLSTDFQNWLKDYKDTEAQILSDKIRVIIYNSRN